ncbi:hypothetical protein ACFXG6_14515 [Streptomyces roseus]|uniref:hypothetical protein n=1 Tax=Streptomyces roseus TaxID=66430 RepID=UPI00367959FA
MPETVPEPLDAGSDDEDTLADIVPLEVFDARRRAEKWVVATPEPGDEGVADPGEDGPDPTPRLERRRPVAEGDLAAFDRLPEPHLHGLGRLRKADDGPPWPRDDLERR